MQVICEFASSCGKIGCYYQTAKSGSVAYKALCTHRKINHYTEPYVNILEFGAPPETDPNTRFKRMKDGL